MKSDPTPFYSPPWIPRQLENKLRLLSDEPYILFVGIVLRYILRTNNEFNEYLEKYKTEGQEEQELSFKPGDVITIDKYSVSNQMDGYYKEGYRYGKLLKKNKMIKFPNFKVKEYVETYESLAFD